MVRNKTCFVISPIGDEGSKTREEADALLWIIRQALEKYQFDVVRIDEIARSSQITNEIVQHIQESPLCVIILTGENPNVFYEAGRRHETGKPFIQLIRKGERIPFDVAGIRTIIYDDVDSRSAAARTITEIQKYIEEFERTGYGSTGSGISLSTIAVSLDRLERKVSQAISTPRLPTIISHSIGKDELIANVFSDPRDVFNEALSTLSFELALWATGRIEDVFGPSKEVLAAATVLVQAFYEPATDIITRLLTENLNDIGYPIDETIFAAVAAIRNFYTATGKLSEALKKLNPIIDNLVKLCDSDPETQAIYLNQLQMIYYGLGEYEQALIPSEETVRLSPTTKAYLYNLSLIYDRLDHNEKAVEMVDRYLKADARSVDHLINALHIYRKVGLRNKVREIFSILQQVSPDAAKSLAQDPDMNEILRNEN